jgi:hypothetical protein
VRDYLLRGSVTLLVGQPSTLKSSIALAWAASIALGRPFGDFVPKEQGSVVVYNVEDDKHEQQRRLTAVLRQFEASGRDIAGRMHRAGPKTIGTLFERAAKADRLQQTSAMDKLAELIEREKPVALIVDPLAELHTVEENDNTALREVIARFRALAVEHSMAVVVLHHTRKGSAQAAGDADSARGASSIIGAVRVALTLTNMTEDDAKALGFTKDRRNSFVRMDRAKANYSALGDARWFEKVSHELANGDRTVAAWPWDTPPPAVVSNDDIQKIVADIQAGYQEDLLEPAVPWSPKLDPNVRSVRNIFAKHKINGSIHEKVVMDRLRAEFGMEQLDYKNEHRHVVKGLRIDGLPKAQWVETAV